MFFNSQNNSYLADVFEASDMCGMVSIAPQRLMRLSINKNERNKLLKEMAMADVLASHGFRYY